MKRLILCCDGTWNRADQESNGVPCPTNVVKLGYRLAKRDGDIPQVVHYDHGVGTGNSLDRLTGGAFGYGIEDNIHGAYRFLVANYEKGDEIFLFGFSRGAFTSRLRADPTQELHDSVRQRWQQDPDYRPQELREYFRRMGDPLAVMPPWPP